MSALQSPALAAIIPALVVLVAILINLAQLGRIKKCLSTIERDQREFYAAQRLPGSRLHAVEPEERHG